MKKSTKSVALVLSAMMLLPVVSGCGNSQESETGSTVSAETASSKTSEATSSETSEGKPVLKHLIGSISTDPNKGYLKSRLQELTGYEVEYEMLPKENSLDALNLKLASGINYDIITTGADITSRATMDKLARQGALTQLDDLIKEYGPNVEQSVNQVCWDMTMVDGKKYMIANIDPGSTPKGNFWCPFIVREDLCEKLDMKFPDTLDGFVEFLTAVKEQDPAGKGDQNIPFTIFPGSDLSVIRSAFGIYHGWNDVDGKLVPVVEDPRYKEYLSYMQKLYAEGLIDVEYPTNLDATVMEKFSSGRAAVTLYPLFSYGTLEDALLSVVPDAKMNVYMPLKSKDGSVAAPTTTGLDKLVVIPATSEHKEDAMKYINLRCEPEIFKISVIGDEGVHHKVLGENQYEPIQPAFFDDLNNGHAFIVAADDANYSIYWREARLKKDIRNYNAAEKTLMAYPETAKVNPMAVAPLLPIYADSAPSLDQMVNDFEIAVITGVKSVDDLESFATEYMNAGGSEAKAEVNEWWSGYRDSFIEQYGE